MNKVKRFGFKSPRFRKIVDEELKIRRDLVGLDWREVGRGDRGGRVLVRKIDGPYASTSACMVSDTVTKLTF
jgi:hypothetical protein